MDLVSLGHFIYSRTLVAAVLASCVTVLAGPWPDTQRAANAEDRARAFLSGLRSDTGTPAVSGAVARGGELIFSFGTGLADAENGVAATGRTVYNIGSISKAITGVAIMQLEERKAVSLGDDIRKYVPEFPDKGVPITLRHLLTHTSGIRHYHANDFPGTPDVENMQPVDGFRDGLRFFAQEPLLFRPGTYYFYSSYAVNLLEGVVEKASGIKFEQYLRERLWRPAGMVATTFDRPERIVPGRAKSYRYENGELRNYYYNDLRYKFASGGMLASVEDLVRLGAAINKGTLLSRETTARMFTSQIPDLMSFREDGPPEPPRRGHGLLWELRQDSTGRRVAFHCGSIRASNACVVNFIDQDLVAAVATNSWRCCGWAKADELAALFR